jgi:hypothetical protein
LPSEIADLVRGVGIGVDSSSKLSQRTRPILSHLFVEEFGYSDVDKSTVIFVS